MTVNDVGFVLTKGAIKQSVDHRNMSRTNNFNVKALSLESLTERTIAEMSENERIVSLLALPPAKLGNDGFSSTDFHAVNDVCDFH